MRPRPPGWRRPRPAWFLKSVLPPSALIAAALLGGCRQQEAADQPAGAEAALVSFAGVGRDRLCLARDGSRAGFVTYGAGDNNCSVRGALGQGNFIVPDGDDKCRIALRHDATSVTLGPVSADCAYYCAPGATFAGKSFRADPEAPLPTDLAGDPLC